MAIETLDDIVEEIMNSLGIYGSHDDRCNGDTCRSCQASDLTSRIRKASEVEILLSHHHRMGASK